MCDFVDKMYEWVRRLGQFCRPPGYIAEIRRLVLNKHSDGWLIWRIRFPLTFHRRDDFGA